MGVILLATDGGEYARRAAERAIDLAEERGEPLHVIRDVDRRRFDDHALGSAELATIYAEDMGADVIVLGEHGDHDEHFRVVGWKIAGQTDRDVEVAEAGAQ
jgi:nucleotide-binding universal stress UspA family protein